MRIHFLTLIIFMLDFMLSFAQDPHFSNIDAALSYSDPSSVSFVENPQAGITYRNQWPGLQSAYVTYGVYYIHPLTQYNSTISAQILHDVQGDGSFSKSLVSGLYAYKLKASEKVELSAGLQVSYFSRRVDPDKLTFESELTGDGGNSYDLGFEKYKNNSFDFSLGLSLSYNDRIYSGISVQHVTKPVETSGNEKVSSLHPKYTGYITGEFNLSQSSQKKILIKPGIQFMKQYLMNEILYGTTLNVNEFGFGLWARNNHDFSFNAIIFILGFSYHSCSLYYSYDLNLKSEYFQSQGIGAHEVTFSWFFKYKEKRKRWAQ